MPIDPAVAADPEPYMRRALAAAGLFAACAAAGFSVRAAFECEFTLAVKQPEGGFAPLDESLCFSTVGMTTESMVSEYTFASGVTISRVRGMAGYFLPWAAMTSSMPPFM